VASSESKFSAYGITKEDDPLSQALHGLVSSAASQDHQIALLWKAIETLSAHRNGNGDCMPEDAARTECFEAEKLNQLLGE
jgi:serine O-acetyltransferase